MGIFDRTASAKVDRELKHAWNVFKDPRTSDKSVYGNGNVTSYPSHHPISHRFQVSELTSAVFNRIATDVANIDVAHVKIKDKGTSNESYEFIRSGLGYCLGVEANLDQSGIAFMTDLIYSMFDEGVVAVVPTDTAINPVTTTGKDDNSTTLDGKEVMIDILSLRVGRITHWYSEMVRVELFNQETNNYEEVIVPKRTTAIIENPFYSTVNATRGTLKRLVAKMATLDAIDAQRGSKKMNLILQLPYTIKGEARRAQAEARISDIERQMNGNQYGIAYVDGTERITQLNRPLENNLLDEIQYLTDRFYSELGLTPKIFDGTANEMEMKVYQSRIDLIMKVVLKEFERKFITKNARVRGHELKAFRDPFTFLTMNDVAEIGDKMRRNEILMGNEIRKILGFPPLEEEKAQTLANPNMPVDDQLPESSGSASSPDKIKMDANKKGGNTDEEA